MDEKSIVEFVEEWQRGAFLLVGHHSSAASPRWSSGRGPPGRWGLVAFFVELVLAFLAFS
ncbi:hypothetical protein [Haloferax chudinovii]|uniref:DUF8144 domain-containing protein n=1 Tax=Haloferax chudinovii TaxID=1109010 RepID=A0ABD5XH62_9EURY